MYATSDLNFVSLYDKLTSICSMCLLLAQLFVMSRLTWPRYFVSLPVERLAHHWTTRHWRFVASATQSKHARD